VTTVSGWWLSLPLVGNILLIMVNDDGYYMVNDGYRIIIWLVFFSPTPLKNDGVRQLG